MQNGCAGIFDRLDAAVVGPAGDDQALPQLRDALVVVGVDVVDGLAEDVRRGRARLRRHAVAAERAELRTVRREVELGATEVLHERSAALAR